MQVAQTVIFRAYEKNLEPNNRAARLAALIGQWLQRGHYVLTEGPAEPFSRPANLAVLDEAVVLRKLNAGSPLNLWRYPLEVQLQTWTGGWDVLVRREMLHAPRGFRQHHRRRQLRYLLRDLVASPAPRLLVGPTQKPPVNVSQALREYGSWTTLFVGPALYRTYQWETRLSQRGARVERVNDGLWAEIPHPHPAGPDSCQEEVQDA